MSGPGDIVKKYIQPGTRVGGRYDIEGYVGAGAYGVIFSAIDVETMERVAVKAIPPADDGVNRTAVGRFKREFKVISRLRHPNIITLYDFGETENRIIYMVLEFIDGRTLYDVVTSEKLTDGQAISITRQIAAALAEAHGKGVIHRDLKPQNVMVYKDHAGAYQVKVLDFGMAKLLSGADESLVQLTREGVAVGTPRYIAPEQARGKDVGPYSDLYALGLLFYETFTGERAVKADTIESAIIAHVSPEPLELEEIERVPKYARSVLFRLIEKSVDRRYQDAREVVRDLDQLDQIRLQAESASTVPLGTQAAPEVDMSVLNERRSKAHTESPRSIHSADDLELDYDRYQQFSRGEDSPPLRRGRREIGDDFNFRTPHHIFEWSELVFSFFLAPFAFILFTAQFEGVDYFLRFFLGLLATFIPLGISLFLRSNDWSWSFFRLWIFGSITAILIAHLLGIDDLAIGLLRNPGWFLTPVKELPFFGSLFDIVASISRTYADLIADRSLKP